ncbi:MAG: DUF4388 domain-containing protein [Holophagae bacterium]
MTDADPRELAEARNLLARYLSDEIAPMIFADTAEILFNAPVEVMARAIHAWVGVQLQGPNASPIIDYLLHSARKVHHLGELELIAKQDLKAYLQQLYPLLISICPEPDRAELAAQLEHLDVTESEAMAAKISVSRSGASGGAAATNPDAITGGFSPADTGRTGGTPAAPQSIHPPPDLPPAAARSSRGGSHPAASGADATGAHIDRLNLLLDRWERLSSATKSQATAETLNASLAGAQSAIVSRIIDEVATSARSSTDLNNQLRYLGDFGVSSLGSGVFRALSGTLPDWAPSQAPSADDASPSVFGAAETMRKVVELSKDPQELTERFRELVTTAVEHFNEGSLGRTVTVLDLAQRMLAQKEVDASRSSAILDRASDELDQARLKAYTENSEKQLLLRRVLAFFPRTQVDNLIQDLIVEDRRDRRRLILRLLMIHGDEARSRAIKLLNDSLSGNVPQPWYVQRNLIYLMRSIEPGEDADINQEIDLLVRASVPGGELPLIRESLTALGQIDHPRSVQTLTARISDLEDVLLQRDRAAHDREEIQSLLDTAIKALIRFDSKEARECVVTHGLKRRSEFGDTLARLAMLGTVDLSQDQATVNRIIEAVREELPVKVFGVSVKTSRKTQVLERLIESLSGTDIPKVRKVYDGIVRNYAGEKFANAAARALTRLGGEQPPDSATEDSGEVTSLSGDLALFGLPNLMQNLADSRIEGVLTVLDESGSSKAKVTLADGMMIDAATGDLEGETAIYQLLERPVTGRFIFVNQPVPVETGDAGPPGTAVMSLLMEGMRRYDEFNRAVAVVAEDGRYKATGQQPTGLADEDDPDFVNGIWVQATKGLPPTEIEAAAKVDGYRILRLFEHWVNEGSLVTRED